MASFTAPPVGRHVHVIDPPLRIGRQRFGRTHCAQCGFSLEFLLRTQPVVEITRKDLPPFYTNWSVRADVMR